MLLPLSLITASGLLKATGLLTHTHTLSPSSSAASQILFLHGVVADNDFEDPNAAKKKKKHTQVGGCVLGPHDRVSVFFFGEMNLATV